MKRLIDTTRDPLVRELLEEANQVRPPSGSMRRVAKRVGVSASALMAASVATATSEAAVAVGGTKMVGAASGGAAASQATAALVVKGLLIGAGTGLVTVGGGLVVADYVAPAPTAQVAPRAPAAAPSAERQVAKPVVRAAPPASAEVTPSAPEVEAAAPPVAQPPAVATFAPPSRSDELRREVELVDEATQLLRSDRPRAALRLLNSYEARVESRELAAEVRDLRRAAQRAVEVASTPGSR